MGCFALPLTKGRLGEVPYYIQKNYLLQKGQSVLVKPLFITLLCCLILTLHDSFAEDRPSTGKKVAGYESVDAAMHEFMNRIECQAGTVAISKDGQLLYSRGFGWSDGIRTKSTQPDALMRLAGVSKSITAAAVKNAIRDKKLSYDTKAIEFIGMKPAAGKAADARLQNITVRHLLEHQGGWDRTKTFDPVFSHSKIQSELRLPGQPTSRDVLRYMLSEPLQFNPGEKTIYSNFGYLVLGRVLEKALDKAFHECIRESICTPLNIVDIKPGASKVTQRALREVWYPVHESICPMEIMDADSGMIASAPALCKFLDAYWVNGEVRPAGKNGNWTAFGAMPGITTMARQRDDGYHCVVLLNNRRAKFNKEDTEALKSSMDKAIDAVKGK